MTKYFATPPEKLFANVSATACALAVRLRDEWHDHTLALILADAVQDALGCSRATAVKYAAIVRLPARRALQIADASALFHFGDRKGRSPSGAIREHLRGEDIRGAVVLVDDSNRAPRLVLPESNGDVHAIRHGSVVAGRRSRRSTVRFIPTPLRIAVGARWILRHAGMCMKGRER